MTATKLGSSAIKSCLDKANVSPSLVEEVFMGCVIQVQKIGTSNDDKLIQTYSEFLFRPESIDKICVVRTGSGSGSPGSSRGRPRHWDGLHHHQQGLRQRPQGDEPGHGGAQSGTPERDGGGRDGESLQLSLHSPSRSDSVRRSESDRHL